MIYLLFSVLISSSLYVIFKWFQKYRISTFEAIVINYLTACLTGFLIYPSEIPVSEIPSSPWFPGTLFLGVLFISVFMVMALTAQRSGLSTASVASKMSVVLPIIFGYFVYHEPLGIMRVSGMVLALIAVYMVATKDEKAVYSWGAMVFPGLLFLGSGTIDIVIKYTETRFVPDNQIPLFSSSIFGMAAILGLAFSVYFKWKGTLTLGLREVVGGIALGVPNYFSIFFLLKALKTDVLPSSTLFTINNVAIVLLSSLLGVWLFRERMLQKNWLGVGLAVLSICLISMTL